MTNLQTSVVNSVNSDCLNEMVKINIQSTKHTKLNMTKKLGFGLIIIKGYDNVICIDYG